MQAVENDESGIFAFRMLLPEYHEFQRLAGTGRKAGIPIVHKTHPRTDLFNKIVQQAHHNGEPGMLFLDAANRNNPVPHFYQLEATNPCGEQWLGPYENCCLGSINLSQHCAPKWHRWIGKHCEPALTSQPSSWMMSWMPIHMYRLFPN